MNARYTFEQNGKNTEENHNQKNNVKQPPIEGIVAKDNDLPSVAPWRPPNCAWNEGIHDLAKYWAARWRKHTATTKKLVADQHHGTPTGRTFRVRLVYDHRAEPRGCPPRQFRPQRNGKHKYRTRLAWRAPGSELLDGARS